MVLMDMANFLGSREQFAMTMRGAYEVLQPNGYMIQFMEVRDITVSSSAGAALGW